MAKYLKMCVGLGLMLCLSMASASKEAPPFVEMEVKGITLDSAGQSPVVILVDKDGKRAFPIWIGIQEAIAIEKELNNSRSPRPTTHDLLDSILSQMKAKVKEVRIVELKEGTYYASLSISTPRGLLEIDARPSDSIVLALKSKAPVYLSTRILDEQGVSLDWKNALGERSGIRVQELTPSLASQFNFKGNKGVLVAEVVSAGIPEAPGIRSGDIITHINSMAVSGVREFEKAFDNAKKVGSVRLSVFRDGKSLDISLSPNH